MRHGELQDWYMNFKRMAVWVVVGFVLLVLIAL